MKQKAYATYRNVLKESQNEEFVEDLLQYNNLSQYISHIKSWIRDLNEHLLTQYDDYRNKQKIQSALTYIKDNYKKDLNMAIIPNTYHLIMVHYVIYLAITCTSSTEDSQHPASSNLCYKFEDKS